MVATWVVALVAGLAGFGLGIGATVGWALLFAKTEEESSMAFLQQAAGNAQQKGKTHD